MGKCPGCGTWDAMTEERIESQSVGSLTKTTANKPEKLEEISFENQQRHMTHISELDRVLGGGIVEGSLVLVGGDPGIGKSTLLLQMCESVDCNSRILYISGEESTRQIKMRAQRLSVKNDRLLILSETELGNIIETIVQYKPEIVIIDSVQTIYDSSLTATAGSVSQSNLEN
jgi:DNA repair protein RadA/Sms